MKPPYYGNIAVAAFLGNTLQDPVAIANVPLSTPAEAAYTAYSDATSDLVRAIVVNMNTFNTTFEGSGLGDAVNLTARVIRTYTFDVAGGSLKPGDRVAVQRLSANGSDAISGITWDGWSYNYELDEGRPVRLQNVTIGEYVTVSANGTIEVGVPDSSAAVLNFVGNGTVPNGTTGGGGGAGASPTTTGTGGSGSSPSATSPPVNAAVRESGGLMVAVTAVSALLVLL